EFGWRVGTGNVLDHRGRGHGARNLLDVLAEILMKLRDHLLESVQVGNLQCLRNDVEHLPCFAMQQDLDFYATGFGKPRDHGEGGVLRSISLVNSWRNHPNQATDARKPPG